MRALAGLLIAAAALLAPALPAAAAEAIGMLNADITLHVDGSVGVVEIISAEVEGVAIKHGLFLDFATGGAATDSHLPGVLTVASIDRDGVTEPFSIEPLKDITRIRIGAAGVLLTPGEHTYIVKYTLTNVALRLTDNDRLIWHVTGNWPFPILDAHATVHLPGATPPLSVEGTIVSERGPEPLHADEDANGAYSITSGVILAPGDKMSFMVVLPKGVLSLLQPV